MWLKLLIKIWSYIKRPNQNGLKPFTIYITKDVTQGNRENSKLFQEHFIKSLKFFFPWL